MPPDVEHLLQGFDGARAEAKMEMTTAQERLRERTELEQKKLQQLSKSQDIKVCRCRDTMNYKVQTDDLQNVFFQ